MKTIKNLFVIVLLSLFMLSCSREEPVVVPVVIEPTVVKMNEIYSRGVTDNLDWVEIYNASSFAVNIGGYKIYDAGGNGGTKPKMEIPANTMIAAKGYYVVTTDVSTTDGFGLSSGGEDVWLEDNAGKVIDNVKFLAMDVTQTYARIPDGGTWALTSSITKGASNK